jgi:glycosyltransferase involved in cell wall biosynthesis
MNENPLISIVLPCYNGAMFLAQSIQSCIDQKYQNWELILVDDCSTDDSYNIMRKFEKENSRIKIIQNAKNLKLPASLNVGFEQAKGEYFTWTSDDNYYLPDCLEELIASLCINQADAIYSGFYRINETGDFIGDYHPMKPENMICESVVGASFLYKRSIHEVLHGYDTNLFLIEDYDFWLRMYLNDFRIITLDKLLYVYRNHSSSLTSARKKDVYNRCYRRIIENILYLDKFPKEYHEKYWEYLCSGDMNIVMESDVLKKTEVKNFERLLICLSEKVAMLKEANKKLNSPDYEIGRKILGPMRYLKHILK